MKPTLLVTMFLAIICQVQSQIIFVRQGATGNGTSWSDASGDLAAALGQATAGTQVWVAYGTYKTTNGTNRNASFEIKDGVKVYGNFNGTETSIQQRIQSASATILTGEIGQPGQNDNAYNVVVVKNAGTSTLIDGFVITAGNANGLANEALHTRCGGGIYIDGENGSSKPTISNCELRKNLGRDGAAVYNNGRRGESSPVFVNCSFKNNEAGLDGGAIYNDGRLKGKSNPTLTNCTFERNMGTYGGAICNATEDGACNLTLDNCVFNENAAYLRGGAVFSLNGDEKCYTELLNCKFTSNFPDDQNMIFTTTSSRDSAYKIAGQD
ncbi:MAG: right-handed parallel beta-helix repeat-containing protein [Saprospiraceae bacterium]|nr:right-handed parallel beta-helix repeat-containing protein [Saprospiraceae bacterium]